MDNLYAPWRDDYTSDTARQSDAENVTEDSCVFCIQLKKNNDKEYFILKRFKYCFVVMNKYPYNAGHLLILPLEHIGKFHKISNETRNEIMKIAQKSSKILENTLKCKGINIGMNLGQAAGAGIPSHLHMHVLPRWLGDTNFLPALTRTKQISFDMGTIYDKLKPAFDALS
jgi:ATP adenylyltransferase